MKRKVLIIEDDIALYNMYSTELSLRGYEVLNVSDGSKAFEEVKKAKPDLILLDVMLPQRNGLDILGDLKSTEETKDIRVVMLTNYGTDENISKAVELGAEDYILKYNIVQSELSSKVNAILGDESDSAIKLVG